MESTAKSATIVDVRQTRQPPPTDGTERSPIETRRLPRDSLDDALLDEFWRRRSTIGHC